MSKCEHENNGYCTLDECIYGDFLFIDDSAFGTGKHCFCDDIEQARNKKEKEKLKN